MKKKLYMCNYHKIGQENFGNSIYIFCGEGYNLY